MSTLIKNKKFPGLAGTYVLVDRKQEIKWKLYVAMLMNFGLLLFQILGCNIYELIVYLFVLKYEW